MKQIASQKPIKVWGSSALHKSMIQHGSRDACPILYFVLHIFTDQSCSHLLLTIIKPTNLNIWLEGHPYNAEGSTHCRPADPAMVIHGPMNFEHSGGLDYERPLTISPGEPESRGRFNR